MRVQNALCCGALAFVNNRIMNGSNRLWANYPYQNSVCSKDDESDGYYESLHTSKLLDCASSSSRDNVIPKYTQQRRTVIQQTISKLLPSMMLLMTNAKSANAACLSGDIRSECIGIYKLPIDAPESGYMDTPERLKAYAPDINWVPPIEYPKNYADAYTLLKDQRQQLDVAQDLVARGDIEKSGLILLDVIPKVSSAGIVMLQR